MSLKTYTYVVNVKFLRREFVIYWSGWFWSGKVDDIEVSTIMCAISVFCMIHIFIWENWGRERIREFEDSIQHKQLLKTK